MAERSRIETAALAWTRARIKLKDADSVDLAMERMRLYDEAQAQLFSICAYELATMEASIVDLNSSGSKVKQLLSAEEPEVHP